MKERLFKRKILKNKNKLMNSYCLKYNYFYTIILRLLFLRVFCPSIFQTLLFILYGNNYQTYHLLIDFKKFHWFDPLFFGQGLV